MPAPRLVSLVPAATDWLVAVGAADRLVGRSPLCDAPEVASVPVVAASRLALPADAAGIDAAVRAAAGAGAAAFAVDAGALAALRPDRVVVQTACGVCAPHASLLAGVPAFDFSPSTAKQVLDAALALGRAAGCWPATLRAVADAEARLAAVARATGGRHRPDAPTVAVVEWVAPLLLAGHWVPDLVAHAGGRPLGVAPGARSPGTTLDALAALDPDWLVVAPCGRTVAQTLADLAGAEWAAVRAVREGRAVVADGDRLFNRPGPALGDAVALLAHVLHGVGAPPAADRCAPFPVAAHA